MAFPRFLLPTLVVPCLAGLAAARGTGDTPAPETLVAARAGTGIAALDGGLVAGGADWEARFDARGVRFVPALGGSAPADQDLALAPFALERGGKSVALASAPPRAEGGVVVYERGAGVSERYTVLPHGLEQSFVLQRPIGGSGDLVLRVRLGGTLAGAERPGGEGARFEGAWGGVRLGAVTAIDARGRSAAGAVGVADGELRIVVPARFVDGAAYPLVIDPLIGGVFPVNQESYDDGLPDVSFDSSTSTFLVVWRRTFSRTNSKVRGQRTNLAGNPIGGVIFFSSKAGAVDRPQVASANHSDRFVVAWAVDDTSGSAVQVQLCQALTGALSTTLDVKTGAQGALSHADVAGETMKNPFTEALVVWDEQNAGILGAELDVPATGAATVKGNFTVAADGLPLVHSSPSISKTGGSNGVFLVAYRRYAFLAGNNFDVRITAVDRHGNELGSQNLTATPESEEEPDVDGGAITGGEYLVAWMRPRTTGDDELNYAAVTWDGALHVVGPRNAYLSPTGFDDWKVAWTPGKALLAAETGPFFFGNHSISFSAFDPRTGTRCEGPTLVDVLTPASGSVGVGIATIASGGSYGVGTALLAFSYAATSGNGDVQGQLLDAFPANGTVLDLGGGCGLGGTLSAPAVPAPGNGYFPIYLQGADPSSPLAILNLSTPQPVFPCGACQWLPFQSTLTVPVAQGATGYQVVIPCDPGLAGLVLDAQWTVLTPLSSPCSMFRRVSLSNRVRITLGS